MVPGLKDFLAKKIYGYDGGSGCLEAKDVKGDVCAYIQELHSWGSSGGIKKDSNLGVFRNGKEYVIGSFNWRDRYDPNLDRYSVCYEKIEITKIDNEKVKVKATNRNGEIDEFEVLTEA